MNRLSVLVFVLSTASPLVLSTPAMAFGKDFLKSAEKAAKNEINKYTSGEDSGTDGESANQENSVGDSNTRNSLVSGHDVKVDPSAPAPSILYSDILKTMQDQVT